MLDPSDLYRLDREAAGDLAAAGEHPAVVTVLSGFVDAGSAGELAAEHLLRQFPAHRLVDFDTDLVHDYRSRRPMMTFDTSRWVEFQAPTLALDVLQDGSGADFLLLHGPEPDLHWERFVRATVDILQKVGAGPMVALYGIPMGVPHTRALPVTAHAANRELVSAFTPWLGRMNVPGSAAALLELRLAQAGLDAVGVTVHVPHYLSTSRYPRSAQAGLERVESMFDLDLCIERLDEAVARTDAEIARQVGSSAEIGALVRALEDQFDAVGPPSDRGQAPDLPSADDIAREFEAYLADHLERRDRPADPEG